jgi:hypothetical protein
MCWCGQQVLWELNTVSGLNLVASCSQKTHTRGDASHHISNWPVRAVYLCALADLGLSDTQIAHYFHVERDKVTSLRDLYCIPERKSCGGVRGCPCQRKAE